MTTTNSYLEELSFLVVDPNPFMRSLVKSILGAFGGKKVYEAETTEQAWDILTSRKPDILLTEMDLPDDSGLSLVRRLRSDPKSPDPFQPVVMLTAHGDTMRIYGALNAGVNSIVRKPLTVRSLMMHLIDVIEKPRPFIRAEDFFGPDRRRRKKGEAKGRAGERRREIPTLNQQEAPVRDIGYGLDKRNVKRMLAGQDILTGSDSAARA